MKSPFRGNISALLLLFACNLLFGFSLGLPRDANLQRTNHDDDLHTLHLGGIKDQEISGKRGKRQLNLGSTVMFTSSATITVTVQATPTPVPRPTSSSSVLDRHTSDTSSLPPMKTSARLTQPPDSSSSQSQSPSTDKNLSSSSAPTTVSSSRAPSPSSISTSTVSTPSPMPLSQNNFVSVAGAGNTCVDRLKVEDMQVQRPDSFNLLLLAWRELQLMPEADDLSFYQLSKVHGAPFGPWQMPSQGNYNWQLGYCTHHSAIFLTWHRPYLVLLEQILYKRAVDIANRFSGTARERFIKATGGVRLPYWDWSDPTTQSHLPEVVVATTVSVIQPNESGAPVNATIQNPLNSYTFQSQNSTSTFWGDFSRWRRTLRQPDSNGVSQEGLADRILQNGYNNRHQSTYLAFSYPRYNDFAANIESVHDEVHGSIGGVGHMTYVPYSAYDPIFWLHHCNMDRIMAMYQASRPDTFVEPMGSIPTFANPSSQLDTADTPLYPFRRFDGSFWTSRDVSTANTVFPLSYGYPEVPCVLNFANFDALRNHTTTAINRLYGPQSNALTKRSSDENMMRYEWQAKIFIDQSELPGSFVVYIFLGAAPRDPNHWAISPNMVGTLTHLGSPGVRMPPRIIETNVILTNAVNQALGGASSNEQVLRYIKDTVNWTVISDNRAVNATKLNTLRISCISAELILPTCPSQLPQKSKETYHLDLTSKKTSNAQSRCDIKKPLSSK
ncbi:hypothetical protein H072_8323 [Dactylellina haptotyla CBS 200.50]|uniref:tyrosinase n=1 Tax=Dactylellina haptotyla (strain CBS 200.50) TaxID=1284197 RepID=S8BRY2_DACHA|nr:hypothetical protein H072_8323 [Dactylellina haptotyla CBS 200.50]